MDWTTAWSELTVHDLEASAFLFEHPQTGSGNNDPRWYAKRGLRARKRYLTALRREQPEYSRMTAAIHVIHIHLRRGGQSC